MGAPGCAERAQAAAEIPSPATEDADIQQAVAHQPVAPVDAAGCLPGYVQTRDLRAPIWLDGDPAVLVVKRRIDQDRLMDKVDIEALILAHHGRQLALDGAGAFEGIDHGRIQPDSRLPGGRDHPFLARRALADEGCRLDIARFQRIDKLLAICIAHLGAKPRTFSVTS